MTGLPPHDISRDGTATKVWHLRSAGGEHVASFTTACMGARGGVFVLKRDRGWTREMADGAFREHFAAKGMAYVR